MSTRTYKKKRRDENMIYSKVTPFDYALVIEDNNAEMRDAIVQFTIDETFDDKTRVLLNKLYRCLTDQSLTIQDYKESMALA